MALANTDISATDIRDYLTGFNILIATDLIVTTGNSMIKLSVPMVNELLTLNSLDYDDLTATQKLLAKGLAIAITGRRIANRPHTNDYREGPIEKRSVIDKDVINQIDSEIKELKKLLGITIETNIDTAWSVEGGDDYLNKETDLRNISYDDTSELAFSRTS